MEIGILVLAFVIVSSVSAYFYLKHYLDIPHKDVERTYNRTIQALANLSNTYSNKLSNLTINY